MKPATNLVWSVCAPCNTTIWIDNCMVQLGKSPWEIHPLESWALRSWVLTSWTNCRCKKNSWTITGIVRPVPNLTSLAGPCLFGHVFFFLRILSIGQYKRVEGKRWGFYVFFFWAKMTDPAGWGTRSVDQGPEVSFQHSILQFFIQNFVSPGSGWTSRDATSRGWSFSFLAWCVGCLACTDPPFCCFSQWFLVDIY